jgi:hypothetical protein
MADRIHIPASRPKSTLAELVISICALSTFMIAGFGIYQFWWSTQQSHIRAAQDAIAKIYPLDMQYTEYLDRGLHLRACMEHDPDGEIWKGLGPDERVKCLAACALLGDIFEYYLLIRDDIGQHPKGGDTVRGWDGYMEDQCKKSYVFRGYVNATRTSWSPMLLEAFDRYTKNLPPGAQDVYELKAADQR